jgi:uncharacterized protein (TIGR03083 family)
MGQAAQRSLNAMEFAGKEALLEAVRADHAAFGALVRRSEQGWSARTPCEGWEIRDLVGHMVDNTETYLEGFEGGRAGRVFPDPVGLFVMAELEDKGARQFRDIPRDELLKRWDAGVQRMFGIFDALDEPQWTGELVHHRYMGPLPAFFFPVFQLMDYSVHTWDAGRALGEDAPLSDLAATILTPFMFILLQYTVDPDRAANRRVTCGIQVSGQNGGSWAATVDNGVFSYEPAEPGSTSAALSFEPSDFVLTCFQRIQGGSESGDREAIRAFRELFFKI